MSKKNKLQNDKGNIMFPYNARTVMRYLEGEDIRVFAFLVEALTPIVQLFINGIRNGFEVSLRDCMGDDGKVHCRVPLVSLGYSHCHYDRTIRALGRISLIAPRHSERLFDFVVLMDGKKYVADIAFDEQVLRTLLDVSSGYVKIPSRLVKVTSLTWIIKLMLLISQWKSRDRHSFTLADVVSFLFVERYKSIDRQAKNRIRKGVRLLREIYENAPGEIGFYVTCEFRKLAGKEEKVVFTYHGRTGTPSVEDDQKFNILRRQIERYMKDALGLSDKQLGEITGLITPGIAESLAQKLQTLHAYIQERTLQNKSAYAYTSIRRYVDAFSKERATAVEKPGANGTFKPMCSKSCKTSTIAGTNVFQEDTQVFQENAQVFQKRAACVPKSVRNAAQNTTQQAVTAPL